MDNLNLKEQMHTAFYEYTGDDSNLPDYDSAQWFDFSAGYEAAARSAVPSAVPGELLGYISNFDADYLRNTTSQVAQVVVSQRSTAGVAIYASSAPGGGEPSARAAPHPPAQGVPSGRVSAGWKAVEDIADELEQEAMLYEGDSADTINGCAEALRALAPPVAATADAAPAGAVAVRNAALEEAAKVCEEKAVAWQQQDGSYAAGKKAGAFAAAEAIRALKSAAAEVTPAPATVKAECAVDALDGLGFTYDAELGWLPPAPATAASSVPDGWISVSDRMPPACKHVLVARTYRHMGRQRMQVESYYISTHPAECVNDDGIAFWMHLPAAPVPADASAEGGREGA